MFNEAKRHYQDINQSDSAQYVSESFMMHSLPFVIDQILQRYLRTSENLTVAPRSTKSFFTSRDPHHELREDICTERLKCDVK